MKKYYLEKWWLKNERTKNKRNKIFYKRRIKRFYWFKKTLTDQIPENINQLNKITKTNDEKLHQLLVQNKKIEIDFKEAEKEIKD